MMKFLFLLISACILVSASAFAQISLNAGGAGGGAVIAGTSTTTCDSTITGALRYNSTAGCIEVCDGISWSCMVKGVCDSTPVLFAFTAQTGVAASTQYSSNIVAVTGMDAACTATVSVSGSGSPEYRICSTSNCSVVDVNWTSASNIVAMQGKYIQLRATSSASGGTTTTATATIGLMNSPWNLTTAYASCSDGPIGSVCADGTIYAGLTPDGNVPMYTTRCDAPMTWNGSACVTAASTYYWNNGAFNWTDTALVQCGGTYACDPSGETDTTALASEDSDSSAAGVQSHNAAVYCNNLSVNGQSDWYLPSSLELDILYMNMTAIGNFAAVIYWASSEADNANAWYENFNGGSVAFHFKSNAFRVRCVRK